MELDDSGPLDTEWIKVFEKTDKLYQDFYKDDIYYVNLIIIYIDRNNDIYKVKHEPFLMNKPNIISREENIEILKKNSTDNDKRYSLLSILRYNINLEPNEVKHFIINRENPPYLSVITNIDNITFDKSISMFHDLNDLIYIFYEKSTELKKHNPNTCSKKAFLDPKKAFLDINKSYLNPNKSYLNPNKSNKHNKTYKKRFKD